MKKLSRYLAGASAIVALLTLVHPQGLSMTGFRLFKQGGGGLTPFMAVGGGLGALIGLKRKDRLVVGTGVLGAALAVRHIVRATAPHDGFAQAFGANA